MTHRGEDTTHELSAWDRYKFTSQMISFHTPNDQPSMMARTAQSEAVPAVVSMHYKDDT